MSEFEKDEGDVENLSPREEIEMLLPWFVTGRLDESDAKRVAQYLEAHPDMAAQLALVREEMDVSITEAEKLGSPHAGHLGELMRSIEADHANWSNSATGIFEKIAVWLGQLQPRQLGFAAMAAIALIVVQGITIGGLMRGGGEVPGYETASGPGGITQAGGTKLLIVFNPEARAADIEKLLGEINGSIVSGPKAGGYYQIAIKDMPLSGAQTETLLKALKSRKDIISFAARSGN